MKGCRSCSGAHVHMHPVAPLGVWSSVHARTHARTRACAVVPCLLRVWPQVYQGGQMAGARLLPRDQLAEVFRSAGVDVSSPLVCSCQNGLRRIVKTFKHPPAKPITPSRYNSPSPDTTCCGLSLSPEQLEVYA